MCVCVNQSVNKQIYFKELARTITEAESSRPRRTSGVCYSQVQVQRQEKTNVPAQRQSGREKILSYSAFYFIQAFKGFHEAHPHWDGKLALLVLQI